jgi:hypothetical protein
MKIYKSDHNHRKMNFHIRNKNHKKLKMNNIECDLVNQIYQIY